MNSLKLKINNFQPNSTEQGINILKNTIIKPDRIKVWLNKPLASKSKRVKTIIGIVYE